MLPIHHRHLLRLDTLILMPMNLFMNFLMIEILDSFDQIVVDFFADSFVMVLDSSYQLNYFFMQFIVLMFEIFLFKMVLFLN
jgi:hypothetical protein